MQSQTQNRRIRERHDARTGWAFMAPFFIMFLLVFAVPICVAIYQSFFRQVASGGGLYGSGELENQFVGFDNFTMVITSTDFWTGMGRVVVYAAFQIPIMIISALVLALVLDSFLVRRVGFFRLSYFLPFAIPGIVAAMVWLYIYTPELSPIVKFFDSFGIHIDFMAPGAPILASMANMTTWTYTGYNMLIFLAALQAIPHELYEAARLDGATSWQIVRQIKVPMVSSAALLAVLLSIIGTIQLFNEPAVMYSSNRWMGNAYTPMMMAYNTMFGQISPGGDGPASAISIVMALVAGGLAVIYALLQRKTVR